MAHFVFAMANENPYDSRNIVEIFIHHKLLKKGYVWHCRSEDAAPPDNGFGDAPAAFPRRPQPVPNDGEEDYPFPNRIPEPDPHDRLHRVLREAGDEIERMYQRDFAEMSGQLHFTPSSAQRKFTAVSEELFRDGVNWGRIVAFFEFGGTMCVESVNREMTSQVDNIVHWMTEYLNGPLQTWIQENGGWDAFVELYGQPRDSGLHTWPYLKTVFGLAALGAAGVTLGALFTQK